MVKGTLTLLDCKKIKQKPANPVNKTSPIPSRKSKRAAHIVHYFLLFLETID